MSELVCVGEYARMRGVLVHGCICGELFMRYPTLYLEVADTQVPVMLEVAPDAVQSGQKE